MLKKFFSRKFFVVLSGIAAAIFSHNGIPVELIYPIISYIVGQSAVDVAEKIAEAKKIIKD